MSESALSTMRTLSPVLVADLNNLLRETYGLWPPGWVNFNWRGYTYDHVQRVTSLALTLCRGEGGAPRVVELASLLHDVTKPYDGEYVQDGTGKRVVDADGYWRVKTRRPIRHNEVTDIYDRLELAGKPHNLSGARVALEVLRKRRVDETLAEAVARTIRDHLLPPDSPPVESLCLYDADIIDANIGLPAFVRNIYIRLHRHDLQQQHNTMPTSLPLDDAQIAYLGTYVRETVPQWANGKRRDFLGRLTTQTGRTLAQERLDSLDSILEEMRAELQHTDSACTRGTLAVVLHYMTHRQDPSIAAETDRLRDTWLATGQPTPQARRLVLEIEDQIHGKA